MVVFELVILCVLFRLLVVFVLVVVVLLFVLVLLEELLGARITVYLVFFVGLVVLEVLPVNGLSVVVGDLLLLFKVLGGRPLLEELPTGDLL